MGRENGFLALFHVYQTVSIGNGQSPYPYWPRARCLGFRYVRRFAHAYTMECHLSEELVLPRIDSASLSESSASPNFSTYAPQYVQCPERAQWVRPATGLSDEEAAWVKGRKGKVLSGLKAYLGRLNLEEFDVDEYIKKIECDEGSVPTIGMAISGGGWSSGLTGTGALRAFDARYKPAAEQ